MECRVHLKYLSLLVRELFIKTHLLMHLLGDKKYKCDMMIRYTERDGAQPQQGVICMSGGTAQCQLTQPQFNP